MERVVANYKIKKAMQQKQAEKAGGHTYSSKAITEEIRDMMEKQKKERENRAIDAAKKMPKYIVSEKERLSTLDRSIIPVLEGEVEITSVMLRDARNKKEFEKIEKTLEKAKRELAKKYEERTILERKLGRTLDYSQ